MEIIGTQHIYKDKQIKDLLLKNKNILLDNEPNNAICYDGIVDEVTYSKQKYKLAFLLKETNGNKSDGKAPDCYEECDYVAWIRDAQSTGTKKLYPTFRNIALWSSVFCDIFENREISVEKYFHDGVLKIDDDLLSSLRKIAVVNLKKTFGGGVTEWKKLDKYLNDDICKILYEEMCIVEPTVVLCGGRQVFDFVLKIHHASQDDICTATTECGNTFTYIRVWDMVYVDFYHTSCRKSRQKMFVYAKDVFETLKTLV